MELTRPAWVRNVAGLEFRQDATRGEIQALRADGTLVRQSTFAGPSSPQASNTQAGVYAQDNWSPWKRLVLQGGLRMDWDRFTQSAMAERVYPEISFRSETIAPSCPWDGAFTMRH